MLQGRVVTVRLFQDPSQFLTPHLLLHTLIALKYIRKHVDHKHVCLCVCGGGGVDESPNLEIPVGKFRSFGALSAIFC